jgi:uncharacterized protein YbjT (DUF2867 family)
MESHEEELMYVITGATGNTGSVAAKSLLAQGKKVRVIGRNADRLQSLAAAGAEPFVAELTDAGALPKAFAGAEAAYVMIPPNLASTDPLEERNRITNALVSALTNSGVKYVVSLSSFGADKTDKTGPVVGLHQLEEKLNAIPALNTLHLRAGYFMENTLGQAGAIKMFGMTAGPLRSDLKLPLIATQDIGEAAADALVKCNFTGHQTRELQGQRDLTMAEVAAIIGKAIGKPGLGYVRLPNMQIKPALKQLGMSGAVADLILEMAEALNTGHMRALEPRSAANTTPTSFEDFVAKVFVPAYEGKARVA